MKYKVGKMKMIPTKAARESSPKIGLYNVVKNHIQKIIFKEESDPKNVGYLLSSFSPWLLTKIFSSFNFTGLNLRSTTAVKTKWEIISGRPRAYETVSHMYSIKYQPDTIDTQNIRFQKLSLVLNLFFIIGKAVLCFLLGLLYYT